MYIPFDSLYGSNGQLCDGRRTTTGINGQAIGTSKSDQGNARLWIPTNLYYRKDNRQMNRVVLMLKNETQIAILIVFYDHPETFQL